MAEMARLAESASLADIMRCKSMILETTASFLLLAGIHEEENFQVQTRFERLFQLVAMNPAQANPIQLAKSLQCHPVQLQREFRRDMGMTLKQYIRINLLESVKIRLQTTGDPIRVIASDFGFPDEFYFSRLFRRRVGVSPRAYRQNNRMSF
jgi:AraC-like DNA-binding protein